MGGERTRQERHQKGCLKRCSVDGHFLNKLNTKGFPGVQWLGVCLPMQGTRVWSLVREDPTCCWTTKPEAQLLRPCEATTEAPLSRARAPQQEKPWQWEACATAMKISPCSPQLEKAHMQQQRPTETKINKQNLKKLPYNSTTLPTYILKTGTKTSYTQMLIAAPFTVAKR